MSADSDIAIMGRDMKNVRRRKRELYGVPCPQCAIVRPRAQASILLPGQVCKVDKYRDPRPSLTREQVDAIWAEFGYTRVDTAAPKETTDGQS